MNITSIILYLVRKIFILYASSVFLFPLASVYQERRIWAHPSLPSLSFIGMFKVYIFNVIWMGVTFIGSLLLLPKYILYRFGGVERDAQCLVERPTAFACVHTIIGPVKVRGREKLLPEGTPCVFIANHASQIDLGVVYFLFRRFKWISKKSVVYLPGVGAIMLMGGHVFIERYTSKSKSASIKKMYNMAHKAISEGTPMFIFPQGTRRLAERLPFKDGAFNMAIASEVPLVPISIEIPMSAWNDLYPLNLLWKKTDPVVLTVHDPIEVTKDSDKEELKKKSFDVIHSVLPNLEKDKEI